MNRYPVGATNGNAALGRNFNAPPASGAYPAMQNLGRGMPMMHAPSQLNAAAGRPLSAAALSQTMPRSVQPQPQQILGRHSAPPSTAAANAAVAATGRPLSAAAAVGAQSSAASSAAAVAASQPPPLNFALSVAAPQPQHADALLAAMMNKAKASQPDFSLQSDDFPALGSSPSSSSSASSPSSNHSSSSSSAGQHTHFQSYHSSSHDSSDSDAASQLSAALSNSFSNSSNSSSNSMFSSVVGKDAPRPVSKSSVSQTQRKDGSVESSSSASLSFYGLSGLLPVIRMSDPSLNLLALGTDLTSLGLNLNAQDVLYPSFGSPWSDTPTRREADYTLPSCYYIPPPTLKANHLAKFANETLFYIFYNMTRDQMQVLAAKELYNRGWKYHKSLQLWFKPDGAQQQQPPTAAACGLTYFDVSTWKTRLYQETHASRQLAMNFMTLEEVMGL